jgi:hypothetical protein
MEAYLTCVTLHCHLALLAVPDTLQRNQSNQLNVVPVLCEKTPT